MDKRTIIAKWVQSSLGLTDRAAERVLADQGPGRGINLPPRVRVPFDSDQGNYGNVPSASFATDPVAKVVESNTFDPKAVRYLIYGIQ